MSSVTSPLEACARALAPLAWAALGAGDTLAQLNRRKASGRHAKRCIETFLSELDKRGWKVVPKMPTEEMMKAGRIVIDLGPSPARLTAWASNRWDDMLAASPSLDLESEPAQLRGEKGE